LGLMCPVYWKIFFPTLHYSTTPSLRAKQNTGRAIFSDPAPRTGFLDLVESRYRSGALLQVTVAKYCNWFNILTLSRFLLLASNLNSGAGIYRKQISNILRIFFPNPER
jgi:hypothetical protein